MEVTITAKTSRGSKFTKKDIDKRVTIRTLKNWWKKFHENNEWNLKDKSQKPNKLQKKFSEEDKKEIINFRKFYGYGAKKLRIKGIKRKKDGGEFEK